MNALSCRLPLLATLTFLLLACEGGSQAKPTGTPTDPVSECEKHGQVCRMDQSRLGVCVEAKEGHRDACQGRFPCLVCSPQH